MFDYQKNRRSLEKRIVEVDKRSANRVKLDNLDLIAYGIANDRFERDHFNMELKVLEAEHLHAKASRYGITSFPTEETYAPQMKDVKPRPYFSEQSKAELHKIISEARFNYWKKRAEFAVPIITLIVAVIAILK
jgi:hypothetical protein